MYVLAHHTRADRVFDNESNALTELELSNNAVVYQYVLRQGYWVAGRRYYLIGDREVVFNTPGNWEVPDDYVMYNFPNACSVCNREGYMQGAFCLMCSDACIDCGNNDQACQCAFTDY